MRVSGMTMPGLIAAGLLLGGCTGDLQKQVALLTQENEDLRQQLAVTNGDLAQMRTDLSGRDQELESLRSRGQGPLAQVTGFENIPGVTASFDRGEVTVAVDSDVLFASGKTALRPEAKTSLSSVVAVLERSYGGLPIRVEGHTDTDPIRKSGHKSNYHLGFERAWAVREYLISKGVESGRIVLASYGPDRPLATKADSRRVEIVVVME